MVIKKTKKYGMFNTILGNRAINTQHVEEIKRSMLKKQLKNPIIVNEKMEVIDGQHRLKACEELDLPVWYMVVDNLTDMDCAICNTNNITWTNLDYLRMYSDRGSISAKRALDLLAIVETQAGASIYLLAHYIPNGHKILSSKGLKLQSKRADGTYYDWMLDDLITEENYKNAKEQLEFGIKCYNSVKKVRTGVVRLDFLKAIKPIMVLDGVDIDLLYKQISENKDEIARSGIPNIRRSLARVYNMALKSNFMMISENGEVSLGATSNMFK